MQLLCAHALWALALGVVPFLPAAQLALRGDKAAESSDDDFEMGETLSEEERARRAKAKAEREGNVHDISDDSVAAGLDASASSSSDSESSSSDSDEMTLSSSR